MPVFEGNFCLHSDQAWWLQGPQGTPLPAWGCTGRSISTVASYGPKRRRRGNNRQSISAAASAPAVPHAATNAVQPPAPAPLPATGRAARRKPPRGFFEVTPYNTGQIPRAKHNGKGKKNSQQTLFGKGVTGELCVRVSIALHQACAADPCAMPLQAHGMS